MQLHDTFEEPGGGGGVAARALPSLGAETRFLTALGDDTPQPRASASCATTAVTSASRARATRRTA